MESLEQAGQTRQRERPGPEHLSGSHRPPALPYLLRVVHALAGVLIVAALVHGIASTARSDWPVGPDTLRDIASAETIRASFGRFIGRGIPLPDPYYRGEVFWYSPLMPALLAAGAGISHAPMHLVATRAPVFWNLAAPIAFYLLAASLFDPLVALASLAMFLYVEPFASREAATYATALITSSFAQPFFYLGLLAWAKFRTTSALRPAIAAGALLGASFLAHTAVTALLALIFTAESLLWMIERRRAGDVLKVFGICALVAVIGLVFASPGFIPLVHYHLQIRELEPFVYLDPAFGPAHFVEFLRANASAYLFTVPALVGLLAIVIRPPSTGRRLLLAWLAASVGLFFWAGYVVRLVELEFMPKLAIAPAHHFLIYVRGAESLLGGIGIVAAVRGVGRLVPSATREATQAAAVVVIAGALIWLALPEYSTRDAHMVAATFSDNQWAAVQWIQNQASPNGVFLAPENTGVSMIGLVGRKTVIVERIFSNPYVDWDQRDTERRAMWDSLVASNCSEFSKHADPLGVTYLLLVDGMTPPIQEGTCGFTRKFDGPPFAIYARQFGHF